MKTSFIHFVVCFAAIILVSEATSLAAFEKVFQFTKKLSIISRQCVESQDVVSSSIPWHVKLCRDSYYSTSARPEFFLDVYLESAINDDVSCEAQAIFKLLPKDEKNGSPIIKNITRYNFHVNNPSYELSSFIKWDLLEEKYVKENEITFEVILSTNPPIRKPKLDQISSKFLVFIEDTNALGDGGSVSSPETVLRGIRWTVVAENKYGFLEINLLADKNDLDMSSTWNVTVTFKLLSLLEEKSISSTHVFTFDWRNRRWGTSEFIEWDKFMDLDNKYIQNDTAMLQVEIYVHPPKPLWQIDG